MTGVQRIKLSKLPCTRHTPRPAQSGNTWRDGVSALLAALFLSAALPAGAELKVIELAIETRADAAVLPSGPLSSLVITPCTGCAPLSLPSSTQSRYFLGQEQVSLDVLRQRLANRPATMLLITYRKDTRQLTRIVANAQ